MDKVEEREGKLEDLVSRAEQLEAASEEFLVLTSCLEFCLKVKSFSCEYQL